MCGIAGLWYSKSPGESTLRKRSADMSRSLAHRGPDAEGLWAQAEQGLALVHRRLSILDLSEAGSQPMLSSCGRFVLNYNGECYNFAELRDELEKSGVHFRGHSDTEVIVEGCARWGIRKTIGRLNGMFAFAVWDRTERRLILARDRIGIKPLYYGWSHGVFWFGSELKAVRPVPELQPRLNLYALGLFFKYGYIPAPDCIFDGFKKLSAGHLLELSRPDEQADSACYWPAISKHRSGALQAFGGEREEAVHRARCTVRVQHDLERACTRLHRHRHLTRDGCLLRRGSRLPHRLKAGQTHQT